MRVDRRVRGWAHQGMRARGARRAVLMLSVAGSLLSGCVRRDPVDPAAEPPAPTYLVVDNQAFEQMTIYVVSGAQRVRLGTAGGVSTTRLRIPNDLIFGLTSLAFIANPLAGKRLPISEEITVAPGDEVVLVIPAR